MEPGRPYNVWKEEIENSITNFALTERWNWTPKQIRSLEREDLTLYKIMLSGVTRGESEQQRRQQSQGGTHGRPRNH